MTAPAPPPAARRELLGRVLVTAAAVAVFLLLDRIPLPFVNREPFEALVPRRATLGMFGLAPFLGAYVLVELVALAVPALRRRRHGDAAARAPLTWAAWGLALAFVLVQAAAALAAVRGLRVTGGEAVVGGGLLGLLSAGLAAVAGAALAAGLARWIDRRGLASGFAVLLAAEALVPRPQPEPLPAWRGYVPAAAALLVAAGWTAWLLRRRGRTGPAVPAPTCGIVPFVVAVSVLLAQEDSTAELARRWAIPATLALAALLALAFSPRRRVRSAWAAAGVGAGAVLAALRWAHLRTLLWMTALAAAPLAFATFPGPPLRPAVLVDVAVVVAVVLDLAGELRARARSAGLVAAYPLHRVHAVDPALAALAAAGIPAAARGRHFRALLHFFAPYAPIELLVPPDRAEEAAAVCARIARAAPVPPEPPSPP